jgi:hypothetical protein
MRLPFRQGIVTAQTGFLVASSGSVNLAVNPTTPIVLTFADKDANYTVTERVSVNSAWPGPFTPSTNYWLYWDINIKTGVLTRGSTTLAPSIGATAPATPANGQYWFDTTNTVGYVWRASGSRWVRVIRVIAARYNGSFSSVSISSPLFTGTQVGNQNSSLSGYIVFDTFGLPTKRSNDTFFTTETTGIAGVTNSSELKLAATVLEAEAQQTIPAFTVVKLSDFSKFITADSYDIGSTVYGIISRNVVAGDYTTIYTQGVVENQGWNWTTVGAPLYVGSNGALTDTSTGQTQVIAFALTPKSVFFNPVIAGVATPGGSDLIGITDAGHTALGLGAGILGTDNVAIGKNALQGATVGSLENIAIGTGALAGLTTGGDNIAIGQYALSAAVTNSTNTVAIGTYAANNATRGFQSVVIGANTAGGLTGELQNSIILGFNAGPLTNSGNVVSKLYVDITPTDTPLILGDFASNTLTIHGQLSGTDSTNVTKKYTFDASTISPSTTRTYTMPNQNGTLALLSDISGGGFDAQAVQNDPTQVSIVSTADDAGGLVSSYTLDANSNTQLVSFILDSHTPVVSFNSTDAIDAQNQSISTARTIVDTANENAILARHDMFMNPGFGYIRQATLNSQVKLTTSYNEGTGSAQSILDINASQVAFHVTADSDSNSIMLSTDNTTVTFAVDPTDSTKRFEFDTTFIPTGTTRSYTLPAQSGTLALLPTTTNTTLSVDYDTGGDPRATLDVDLGQQFAPISLIPIVGTALDIQVIGGKLGEVAIVSIFGDTTVAKTVTFDVLNETTPLVVQPLERYVATFMNITSQGSNPFGGYILTGTYKML